MLVKVDEGLALDMLMNRVNYWTDDEEVYHLYEAMYENYVYEGVFDGGEFDVMSIMIISIIVKLLVKAMNHTKILRSCLMNRVVEIFLVNTN